MFYESTRDRNRKINPSEAILQGLSEEGGLFVLRDLGEKKLDLNNLIDKNYYQVAEAVLKLFVDFTDEEIKNCVENAYRGKFSHEKITPLVELSDGYVLELFKGPTSAFKDVGLSLLPQLTKTALTKVNDKNDILILTATSGDTGKAALEGFKDVDRTKIMVFYPNDGVSVVQKTQMQTQEGKNTKVCAIHGNFDDAQSGIKELFVDNEFKKQLLEKNIKLSSANSINIGRLIPQVVYYVVAYLDLVNNKKIILGDKVNFVVPTGNFGNILASYYAKQMGIPIGKFVCASNKNKVLFDFFETGKYDRNREFYVTTSPSMDILISSNLERMIYRIAGNDAKQCAKFMAALTKDGEYVITDAMKAELSEFFGAFGSEEETAVKIKEVYDKEGYVMDTHTAVAAVAYDKYKAATGDDKTPTVIASTASPYKFTRSVMEALGEEHKDLDDFGLVDALSALSGVPVPRAVEEIRTAPVLHDRVVDAVDMPAAVKDILKIK